MNNKSCALFRAANLIIMDYPFAEALENALAVCDEAVIVVSDSEDDTADWVMDLQVYHGWERVAVAYQQFHYDRHWQQRWWEFAASLTDAEWLMYHDADEVFHEDDIPVIRSQMTRPEIKLICFPYTHFYMTPSYTRNFYPYHTRLGRRSAGYRMQNWCTDGTPNFPACQMVTGVDGLEAHNQRGDHVAYMTERPFYHYSWARHPRALALSQAKHKAWYTADGNGLADGRLPEVEPHDFRTEFPRQAMLGNLKPYDGKRPSIMEEWEREHAEVWQELEMLCGAIA
jgi:hypothetical protein